MEVKLEDRLETLLNFAPLVEKNPQIIGAYELMVSGAAIELNMPRKYVVDTLYYMSKKNAYNTSYTK